MSQQPEALRLADFLEVLADEGPNWQVLDLSAAELRRLHAVEQQFEELRHARMVMGPQIIKLECHCDELLIALRLCLEALRHPAYHADAAIMAADDAASAAILKATGEQACRSLT